MSAYEKAHELALGSALDKAAHRLMEDAERERADFAARVARYAEKGWATPFTEAVKAGLESVVLAETRYEAGRLIETLRGQTDPPLTGAEIIDQLARHLRERRSQGIMSRSTGVMYNVAGSMQAYEADRLAGDSYAFGVLREIEREAEGRARRQLVGKWDEQTSALRQQREKARQTLDRARSETRKAEWEAEIEHLTAAIERAQETANVHYHALGGPR